MALAILVAGLVGGAAIYVFADYGGKAAMLFDEINRWLAGRFEGKQLGITIAAASVAAALIMFVVAERKK